ncbi:PREDICTED: leucine-rich repeat and coiled-coil domain-containing protein 1-like, partial [Galeopterus variegatus]|uniref:Leucine-rich repeat and coiled-coil domain-containing protein 1-like n=1 Tax=Galeopterus variegatus TaxID=482537 RepID=A0ABM0Q3G8_GALVR
MVHKLQSEIKKLTFELIKAREQQDDHLTHLRTLEKALEKMERQKGQQQVAQMRLIQEVELKASAADREINLLRTSLHQEKEQVQQLHELLTLKEQEHRTSVVQAMEQLPHMEQQPGDSKSTVVRGTNPTILYPGCFQDQCGTSHEAAAAHGTATRRQQIHS